LHNSLQIRLGRRLKKNRSDPPLKSWTVNGTDVLTACTSSFQAASIAPRRELRTAGGSLMNESIAINSKWWGDEIQTDEGIKPS
jgi:hypothetical protein